MFSNTPNSTFKTALASHGRRQGQVKSMNRNSCKPCFKKLVENFFLTNIHEGGFGHWHSETDVCCFTLRSLTVFVRRAPKKKKKKEKGRHFSFPASCNVHNPVCPHLVAVSEHIAGICWNTASKSSSTLPNKSHLHTHRTSRHALRQSGAVSSTLTESVNKRSENRMTSGSFKKKKNCLIIHDSMIYGPTRLSVSVLKLSCITLKFKRYTVGLEIARMNLFCKYQSRALSCQTQPLFLGQSWCKKKKKI